MTSEAHNREGREDASMVFSSVSGSSGRRGG
jgi:hypothetical protein